MAQKAMFLFTGEKPGTSDSLRLCLFLTVSPTLSVTFPCLVNRHRSETKDPHRKGNAPNTKWGALQFHASRFARGGWQIQGPVFPQQLKAMGSLPRQDLGVGQLSGRVILCTTFQGSEKDSFPGSQGLFCLGCGHFLGFLGICASCCTARQGEAKTV